MKLFETIEDLRWFLEGTMTGRIDTSRILSCGCGTPSKEDVERVVREVETEREGTPIVIPVTPERIAAPDWPTRKEAEVESR